MPANKGNRKSNSKDPQDWQKYDFVEVTLSEEEKVAFKAHYAKDPQSLLGLVEETARGGYKLSLTYDQANECMIATLTCKEPSAVNFGYVMTSRAGDTWESIALAMYKHHYACDDEDWGAETRTNGRSWG